MSEEPDKCQYCDEEIAEDDDRGRVIINAPFHIECEIRAVIGSVGHQLRVCSCFGGQGDGDPEGKTRRECARLAYAHFKQNIGGAEQN